MQHMLEANLDPASHLIFGHICATFGPNAARNFWLRVIGIDTAKLAAETNGNPGERRIMLLNSLQSPAPPHAMPGTTGCWIVDYVPQSHLGPVVPQEPYVPSGSSDQIAPQYQGLRAPIWFVNTNGTIGIPLVDALSGRTDALWGNQNLVLGVTRQTTHLSLKWCGYAEYPKQINLYDSRRDQGVRYGQLARKVANFVKDFLDDAHDLQFVHPWAVQNTGQFRSRILIVGLAQITIGHYQPILQLCHGDARLAVTV